MKKFMIVGSFFLGLYISIHLNRRRNFIFWVRENFDNIPSSREEATKKGEMCIKIKFIDKVDDYFIYHLTFQKMKTHSRPELLEFTERETLLKTEKILLN